MSKLIRRSVSSFKKLDSIQEALLEEKCILVNERDDIIGNASKRECHILDENKKSPLHRAFSLFVFNENKELLLQKRSDTKITFPGLWTNTCCSHPLYDAPGEIEGSLGVKKASRRRLQNELGVSSESMALDKIVYLTRILYSSPSNCNIWGEHELDYILFYKGHLQIKPNLDEVSQTRYLKESELEDFVKRGEKENLLTPWFKIIAKTFLPKWWRSLDEIDTLIDDERIHTFS